MEKYIINFLDDFFRKQEININKKKILEIVEIPPSPNLGDYAFPCFILSKELKKSPDKIAEDFSSKMKPIKEIEKIESNGPYLNFFINKKIYSQKILYKILNQKTRYGFNDKGKKKIFAIEFSSPNIAKPFGIGHLRSTLIGNSISNILESQGYKILKINYYGDWGTPFGKILLGYKKYGKFRKTIKDPIKYMLDLYIKINEDPSLENEARNEFKKLERGDKKSKKIWSKFKDLSIKEFNKIYNFFNITFDYSEGESLYHNSQKILDKLNRKKFIVESEGALIVDLEKFQLGIVLLRKTDRTTVYAARDLVALLERKKKYKFDMILYETGSEQNLYFKQIFKIIELLGYKWSKECYHISHGLYLDKDGKKFATRKGKTVLMEEIINKTKNLVKKELTKRDKSLTKKELDKKTNIISRAAIIYGDLKSYREKYILFDIKKFIDFNGNTGPYLLYSFARASSILKKSKKKPKVNVQLLQENEYNFIKELDKFQEIVERAADKFDPSLICNYICYISQLFNEFYHTDRVLGSENEEFKLSIIESFRIVLRNGLSLLGIEALEKM